MIRVFAIGVHALWRNEAKPLHVVVNGGFDARAADVMSTLQLGAEALRSSRSPSPPAMTSQDIMAARRARRKMSLPEETCLNSPNERRFNRSPWNRVLQGSDSAGQIVTGLEAAAPEFCAVRVVLSTTPPLHDWPDLQMMFESRACTDDN